MRFSKRLNILFINFQAGIFILLGVSNLLNTLRLASRLRSIKSARDIPSA